MEIASWRESALSGAQWTFNGNVEGQLRTLVFSVAQVRKRALWLTR
jgi:hypothetical protein